MNIIISDWEVSLACRMALRLKAECDQAAVTYLEAQMLARVKKGRVDMLVLSSRILQGQDKVLDCAQLAERFPQAKVVLLHSDYDGSLGQEFSGITVVQKTGMVCEVVAGELRQIQELMLAVA